MNILTEAIKKGTNTISYFNAPKKRTPQEFYNRFVTTAHLYGDDQTVYTQAEVLDIAKKAAGL